MPLQTFSYASCYPDAKELGLYTIGAEDDSDLQANLSILPALQPTAAPKDCREHHLLWNAGKRSCPVELWIPGLGKHKVPVEMLPSRILFVPAGWRWSWCLREETPALSIRLKESACCDVGRGRLMPHIGSRDADRRRRLEDLAACIRDELLNPCPSDSSPVPAFRRLLPELFLSHFWTPPGKSGRDLEPPEMNPSRSALDRIRAFIHDGVLERWVQDPEGIAQLREWGLLKAAIRQEAVDSGEKQLSRPYFSRLFTKALDISLYEYFQSLRLNHALPLLNGGLKGPEVAERLGFEDLPHFHRVFREAFGMTPAEYPRYRFDRIARKR
jgi:hypothetical protein